MKAVLLCGSSREGNTKKMLEWVGSGFSHEGYETEIVILSEKKIGYCKGCDVCYHGDSYCIFDDDMGEVLDKMRSADAIILASPNYFTNVSAQIKVFIDRCNQLCNKEDLKDKLSGVVCVGAQDVTATEKVVEILKHFSRSMKMNYVGSVVAQADCPNDVSRQDGIRKECKSFVEKFKIK